MAILPIFIPHAGCPHQCVFCNQKTISGQKTAAVQGAAEQIARWRTWLCPGVGNEAAFYGGSFTGLDMALQRELFTLTDALLEEGFIGSVRLSTRPDYINMDELALLKAHHVETVELGVQSMDDNVLATAERGHTAAQVCTAVAMLKDAGFKVGMQLMVGMPGQNFASVQDTVQQTIALHPDIARIYPLLVIQGTPLAAQYAAGSFTPLTLEQAVEQGAYMYCELTRAGINVIRIGLQPDEELCTPGNIIAGPFHPSMGELVKSRVLRDELTPQIAELVAGGKLGITIHCSLQDESKLRGMKNCNVHYWQQYFPNLHIQIVHDLKNGDSIRVSGSVSL